jgi:hypothetical protein
VTFAVPGSAAWLVFRHTEDGTYFRFGHEGGAYGVSYVRLHGPEAVPVTVQQMATVIPQAGDLLEVRQTDGTVDCFVNGVLVSRFVAPSNSARATAYGLAAVGTTPAFDNFSVTPPSR